MRIHLFLALLLTVFTARAEVITWTNSLDGNWSIAANWHPNQVPGAGDFAIITNSGGYSVRVDSSPSILGLVLGGNSGTQTLSMATNVRLTINGTGWIGPNGRLNLTDGELRGSNLVEVAGILTWAGGTLGPTTSISVATNGQLSITGGAAKILQGTLTNAGTVQWTGSGGLVLSRVVHNLASGLFDVQSDPSLQWAIGGAPVLINDGVFRKSGGTGTATCGLPFINNGTVETQTGTLALISGSIFNSGCIFSGAGTNLMIQGSRSGVITLNGLIQSENLVLQGARITGTNTVVGTLDWVTGTIEGDTAMTIAAAGQLTLSGGGAKALQGVLTNAGVIRWTGPGDLAVSRLVQNQAGALFEVQNDQALHIAIGGAPVLINHGIFRKIAGSGTTTCRVPFINNGTVDTRSGILLLPGGSAFNSGSVFSGAGTNLLTSGAITLNGEILSENLVLRGATLNGAGRLNGSLKWLSGTIGAELSFTIPATGQLFLDGPEPKRLNSAVTNAGNITWTGTGDIAAVGVVHNLASGSFEIQNDRSLLPGIGGAPQFINEGLFRKSNGAGTNTCAIPFVNRGTIAVETGTLYFFTKGFSHSSGTISLAGGTLRTYDPLLLESGRLTGFGTVLADVTSAATVAAASMQGTLNIVGDYTQLLAGGLEFELEGATPLPSPGLNVTGTARLNGSLGVRMVDQVVPAPGTELQLMSFASHSGGFCCFNGLTFLGHGRHLAAVEGATNLTLVAQDSPEPASIPLRVTVGDEALICWPWEFVGYALFWSTNLNEPTWTVQPGITNRWLEPAPLSAQKYYQLLAR